MEETNQATNAKPTEDTNAKPLNTFTVRGLPIEDALTSTKDKTDQVLDDVIIKMYEVFGTVPKYEDHKQDYNRTINSDDKHDLRLTELGICNNFELEHKQDPKAKVEYISHKFDTSCIPKD